MININCMDKSVAINYINDDKKWVKMKIKFEYLLLMINGVFLVSVPMFMQWVSMEPSRHSIIEYLAVDFEQWIWWKAIGMPFFIGTFYIISSNFNFLKKLDNKKTMILFAGFFVSALILSISTSLGYLPVICFAISIFCIYLREIKLS